MFRARRRGEVAGSKDRRGAIAVMAALFVTVMMMMGAIAIDYTRMQFFRSQLRTAADAAAHSGAVILSRTQQTGGVADSAKRTGDMERVNGVSPNIQLADVRLGDWDDDAARLDTNAPLTVDAVKVTARYNGNFMLSRWFGRSGGQLRVTSIAWTEGSVINTECLKPWAIPYSALLGSIGHNPADVDYDLSDADIARINAGTMSSPIKISLGGSATQQGNIYWEGGDYAGQDVHMYTPGNFGHLNLDPNLGYRDEILQCARNDIEVGEDVLDSQTGVSVGQTKQGVQALCQQNGSYVALSGQDFDCAVPLKVAIYGRASGTGTNTSYNVKYIGGVVLTAYRHNGWLYAYFTGFATTGNVSSTPGPVKRIILVY